MTEKPDWWQRLWRLLTGPHHPSIDADTYEDDWYRENGGKCHGG